MRSRVARAARMVVEELEPRILYSADAAALVHPGALAHSAEVRLLATDTAPADPTLTHRTGNEALSAAEVQTPRREIVFVDTGISGYQQLLADLHNDPTRTVETVLIDARASGIDQISEVLSQRHDVAGIHIVSHGLEGAIELGASTLSAATLGEHAARISGWSHALTADADILIYGCDVAADPQGQALIDALGRLTGADVAASVDLTGSAARGGDWDLEYRTGVVESGYAFGAGSAWSGTLLATAVGAESQVNPVVGGSVENEASAAMDANGNYAVAWTANAGSREVRMTLFNAAGTALTGEIAVNTFTSGDQRSGSVAMDPAGNSVVVWSSDTQDGAGTGIYGQRFNAAGVAQGAEFQIHDTTAGNQDVPQVAMDGSGNFVVTWTTNQGGDLDVYARLFAADGTALGTEFLVNALDVANDQDESAVAMDSAGNFVVAWRSGSALDGSGTGISAQRYDAAGNSVGAPLQVNSTGTGNQSSPAVAMSSTGFVIAWTSGNNQDGQLNGVFAQRYDASGVAQGGEFLVNTTTADTQENPAVAIDASGNFTIAWASNNQDGSGQGIYGQAYDFNGTRFGVEFQVNTTTTNSQNLPAIAMRASNGDFVVAWEGESAADADGVAAQRYQWINAAPTISDIADQSTNEDVATGAIAFTVGDTETAAGSLVVQATSSNQALVADGSIVLGGAGANRTIMLTPSANVSGTTTITVTVSDSAAQAMDTFVLTVASVNDAPTLTNGATVTLAASDENTTSSATTIDAILTSAAWADVDIGASKGIAVTAKTGNGSWQYSTDGLTWNGFGPVSAANALLLTSTSQVRYLPDGLNGETATFGFKAWDQTTGTASTNSAAAYANPGAGGGATAYSSESAMASMTVAAVNDAPTVTNRALSFDGTDQVVVGPQPNLVMTSTVTMEATIRRTGPLGSIQLIVNKEGEYEMGISAAGKLQWAFANTTPGWNWVETAFTVPADTWVHVAVTYNSGLASTYVDGALVDTFSGTGNIGDAEPALNELTIGGRQTNPLERFSGLIDEVRVWNIERSAAQIQAAYATALAGNEAGLVGYWRFNEGGGTIAVDSSPQGYDGVLGNGVPADVPARTVNLDYTTAEDTALPVAPAGVLTTATDPEGSVVTAALVSGPANASAFTLNPDGSFSYTPLADFSGIDSFVFTASDGSLSSQSVTVFLNVTAVNDAPMATNLGAAETYTLNTPRNLTDIVVSDIDSASVTATLTLSNVAAGSLNTGTSGAVTSTYTAATGVWSASGALADVNTLLAGLTFTPAPGFNSNFTIATGVSDGVAAPVTGTKVVTFNETISGTVFEDVNYGGGAGRDRLAAGGVGRAGARVELYDAAGNFLTATTTSATGAFTLEAAPGNYFVRVVNDTVSSSRTGYVPGLLPVQTFRVDGSTGTSLAVTDRVGGENPTEVDAGVNLTSQTLAVLNAAAGQEIQSITAVNLGAGALSGVDFGFNFDTIVNTRDAGQGSLRQFILNANALGNLGLSQVGQTAGQEVSVFMISDGVAHPGLRVGLTNQLATVGGNSGAALITLATSLPGITDANTSIDGRTQTVNIGNTNAGSVGTGGTVGVDGLVLNTVTRPEVAINAAGVAQAFLLDDLNVSISDMAVYGVDRGGGPTGVQVRVTASATAAGPATITRMLIGTLADGTDPGAGRGDFGGRTEGAATVSNNFIAYLDWDGFSLSNLGGGPERVVFSNNEVSFSGFVHTSGDLLTDIGNNAVVRGNLFHDTRFAGPSQSFNGKGIELWFNARNNLIENNTIFNAQTAGIGINTNAQDNVIRRNIVTGTLGNGAANTGPGILVTGVSGTPLRNFLTENSLFGNAGLAIDLDLRTTAATALGNGVTANDGAINNARPNAEIDSPVFNVVTLSGTTLTVKGYVGSAPGQSTFANARVEIFRSAIDPSGFGEGQTFLGYLTTDASGNFSGTLTVSGLSVGDSITATASSPSNNTSEFGANQIVSAGSAPVAVDNAYSVNEDATLAVNWWDASWTRRQALTFSGNTFVGAETLASYPVLITLNSGNIDYAQTQNDGADLRFFDADGTALAYQIERWDEAGNSYVWVKVPQVDTSGSDSILMYYGNATAAAGQNPAEVWTGNGYQAVYHLSETSGTTTAEASPNGFSGTLTNGVLPGTGQIGGAQSFDGVNDFINLGTSRAFVNGVSQVTLSAWINPTAVAGTPIIFNASIDNGATPTASSRVGLALSNGQVSVFARAPDSMPAIRQETTTAALSTGTWSHVVGVIDYATNMITIYVNGVAQTSTSSGPALASATTTNTNSTSTTLGSEDTGVGGHYSGLIDEARVAATARSAAWIRSDFLSTTNAFVTVGGVETAPATSGLLANDADVNGDRLRAVLVAGPANGSLSFNADGTFTYTPTANFNGTDSFTYRANDGGLDSNVATVTLTVNPVNDAPMATNLSAAETYTEDTALNLTDIVISDIDSASVTATLTLSNAAAGSLNTGSSGAVTSIYDAGTGMWSASGALADINSLLAGLTFTPSGDFNGNFTIATSVTDGVAAPITGNKAITGTPVNDAPLITSNGGSASASVNVAENATAVATVSATDVDLPVQTLTYSIVGGADQALFAIDANTGALSFITGRDFEAPSDAGADNVYDVTVQASDGVLSDTQAIAVTVTPVNENNPVVGPGQSFSLAENSASTTVVGTVVASDADSGTSFTGWTITAGNTGGAFAIDSASGQIAVANSAALDFESNPAFTLTLSVSDGTLTSAGQSVTVNLSNVNESPTLANPLADQGATQDALFGFVFPANTFADVDVPDTLTYTTSALPAWLSFDSATRTFSGTPAGSDVGALTVTLTATDGGLASASDSFDIVVANPVVNVPAFVPPFVAPPFAPGLPVPNAGATPGSVASPIAVSPAAAPSAGFAPAAPAVPAATSAAEAAGTESTLLLDAPAQGSSSLPSQGPTRDAATLRNNRSSAPPASTSSEILRMLESSEASDEVRQVLLARELPSGLRSAATSRSSQAPDESQDQATPNILTVENGVRLTGVVLSVGAVSWALQGAGLLASLITSVPAWRHLDPLPVLAPDEDKPAWRDEEGKDTESQREEDAASGFWDADAQSGEAGRTP